MPLFSFTYAIPYLLVLSALTCAWTVENKHKAKTIVFIFLLLLIFIGLRGHLYTDYISYYPYFNSLPTLGKLNYSADVIGSEFEPGFVFYTSLLKTLWPNYFFFTFLCTLIDLLILFHLFRRYTVSVALAFMFFFAFGGLLLEVNLLRNVKSIMLFLLSIPYLKQRKILPYMVLNLIGFTFHQTAIVYLLCYFFLDRHLSKKVIAIIFIATNIVFFLKLSFTNQIINWIVPNIEISRINNLMFHLNSAVEYGFSVGYFERTIFYLFIWYAYDKLIAQNEVNRIFCNSFIIYYVLFYFFYDVSIFVTRFSALFSFSYWFLGGNIYYYILSTRYLRMKMLFLLVIILCFLKVTHANISIISDYNNVMTGVQDYNHRSRIYLHNEALH